MPYDETKRKMVANTSASAKARSVTLGPDGSFPAGDAKHARLAISGATRSANAGNISTAEAALIKARAKRILEKK